MLNEDHWSGSSPSSYAHLMISKIIPSTGTYFSTSGATPSSPLLLLPFMQALAFLYSSTVKGPSGMGWSLKICIFGSLSSESSGGLPSRFWKGEYQVSTLCSALSPWILTDWEDFLPEMSLMSFWLLNLYSSKSAYVLLRSPFSLHTPPFSCYLPPCRWWMMYKQSSSPSWQ